MPEEQEIAIVDWIINSPPGGGPHSGQTPATPKQARYIRGARGRSGRVMRGGSGSVYRGVRERGATEGRIRRPLPHRRTNGNEEGHEASGSG